MIFFEVLLNRLCRIISYILLSRWDWWCLPVILVEPCQCASRSPLYPRWGSASLLFSFQSQSRRVARLYLWLCRWTGSYFQLRFIYDQPQAPVSWTLSHNEALARWLISAQGDTLLIFPTKSFLAQHDQTEKCWHEKSAWLQPDSQRRVMTANICFLDYFLSQRWKRWCLMHTPNYKCHTTPHTVLYLH